MPGPPFYTNVKNGTNAGHKREPAKPAAAWRCRCPKDQPGYRRNCPECWARREECS